MNPVSLRRAGILALSLALISLVIIAFLSQRNWSEFERSNESAHSTQRILTLNEAVFGHLRDAETSQRGYLLTKQPDYLARYQAAVKALPGEIEELLSLTRGRPLQFGRAQQLQTAAQAKMQEMDRTIGLRESEGLEAALELVRTGRGQRWTDEIRRLSGEIESDEFKQWSDSSAAVQFHANQARQLTI